MKIKAGTGMFRFRPYVDATNGCVIDSSDAAETAYLPFTISALNLRLFGNSGVGVSVGTTGIVQCGSSLEVNSATDATSTTAAALVVSGGVGIAKKLRVGQDVIIGTDPGGSQLLRIGGSVRADNFYVKNAQAFRGYNAAVSTDYRLIGITASDVVNIDGDGRGAFFGATDPGGTDALRVGGALTVNSAVMIQTKTAFTNGAAAAAGTLLNAPVAGNPTKWIPINDNGTTRYLPAW
jgi:hypothetical protein